ncbi:exo-beta-N-acetylmuramidase NamZ family protein [Thiorhodococcus minor]|uniref:DUF1343 domain-containing protein n=1 Tax=Thiorhodococcus minor TaxID=57489 RepID=A0A6M0K0W5_9GAMM|nr:DUF1343 domain-containing protein [Thiorhodococcus minor]NEV61955.1 DUF1343 domain-containing protein [Thiorhodococcus minor]
MTKLGIDRLLDTPDLRKPLWGRRAALLGHAASMTSEGIHTLDALMALGEINLSAAFGPQHGMKGDKQDNMIETTDEIDPSYGIPIFSLYGEVRYPTQSMLDSFDVLLVDLQDIGTRIYTYVTTLAYLLESCSAAGKSIWILDRPNPAGRPMEGTLLEPGWESFVGAGPMLMRHGLTLGELAKWMVSQRGLDLDLHVVAMENYRPAEAPGYGWPLTELSWINPSPNASSLNMARCFPGTVLLEGTTLSEGRGTTTALELVGAPDLSFERILKRMRQDQEEWVQGALIRPCWLAPTFHKHAGKLCSGLQLHTDNRHYRHEQFRPYRLMALLFKSLRAEYPDYPLWRDFHYEYETERLAIDLLAGGPFLREWVDDPEAQPGDFDRRLAADESVWADRVAPHRIYG